MNSSTVIEDGSDQRVGFMAIYSEILKDSEYHMELNRTPTERCINVYSGSETKRCLSVWLKRSGMIDVVFRKELYQLCRSSGIIPECNRIHNNQYYVRMDRDTFHEMMRFIASYSAP